MKKIFLLLSLTIVFGQYDFNLEDLNSNSEFYEQVVGPNNFDGQIVIVYFGHYNWGTCSARFGQLSDFYEGLVDEGYQEYVKLFGVGKTAHLGYVSNWTNNNDGIVNADASPYLTWDSWNASQRDLYVFDDEGTLVYNANITSGINADVYSLIEDLVNEISSSLLSGDLNSDGDVNVIDVVQLVSIILDETSNVDGSDLNSDGLINVIDVVALINIILTTN